jgi:hypothetical protein
MWMTRIDRSEGVVVAPFKCIMRRVDFIAWPSEYGRDFWWWGAGLLVFTLRGALPPAAM